MFFLNEPKENAPGDPTDAPGDPTDAPGDPTDAPRGATGRGKWCVPGGATTLRGRKSALGRRDGPLSGFFGVVRPSPASPDRPGGRLGGPQTAFLRAAPGKFFTCKILQFHNFIIVKFLEF